MEEKEYTKKELKHASNNPWIFPCCKLRFPTKEEQAGHWRENSVCGTYAFDGKVAVLAIARGYPDVADKWRNNNPIEKLVRDL